MKNYLIIAILSLLFFGCQHYDESTATPITNINGKWTFSKDTIDVLYATTTVKEYINNIGAGSTLQFNPGTEWGSTTYIANPDTTLSFVYTTSGNDISIRFLPQTVYGVARPEQDISYTIVQSTAHLLVLNYRTFFFDPLGTEGEVNANYYWTR